MTLALDRVGSGPTLVLIHGLGADRHIWKPVMDRLGAERDVLAIDMPGFGDTPPLGSGSPPSPPGLAARIAEGLRELGVERAHVAGNSLGGWVALELALLGVAESVTAIAPAGLWARPLGPKPNLARRLARGLLPAMPYLMTSPIMRRLALAGSVARPGRIPPADAADIIRAYVEAPDFVAVNAAMRSSRFERLDEVDVPLTFGWPTQDRLISKPRKLPDGSTSVELKGAGHMPMWDDPEAVSALILSGSRSVTALPRR